MSFSRMSVRRWPPRVHCGVQDRQFRRYQVSASNTWSFVEDLCNAGIPKADVPRPDESSVDDPVRSRSDAAQPQLEVLFDVDLDESRQQPCADHLLERLAVARIRRFCQENDAPQVQRHLVRAAHSVADVKQRLEGAGHQNVAVFFNHLGPSQEIDGLLGVAYGNVLEDTSFIRRNPSALY